MRIAVNTRLLLKGKLEGLGRFTNETLQLICPQHPEHEFFFLFDRSFDDAFIRCENINPIVVSPPARHPILWHVWFEVSLPRVLKRINPDLFLSPDGFLSLNSNVKTLSVIHDLNFVHNPQDLAGSHAWFYNRYFPKYAERATRIATVSEFSKGDIVTQYGIEKSKIDVVYNGVSARFQPITNEEKAVVKLKFTEGKPYFIYVGSIHQRKNIERMLKAFDAARSSIETNFKFVLVGNKKWWTTSMQKAYDSMKYKNDVIFTGRVSDQDLNSLVGAAFANIYVSTFEGFGIPIIEAFQAGVPVITSDVTSMPEIAGDAALMVDPFDVNSISNGIAQLAKSEELRTQLISKGFVRAKQFTWQRTADLLWNSVIKTLN